MGSRWGAGVAFGQRRHFASGNGGTDGKRASFLVQLTVSFPHYLLHSRWVSDDTSSHGWRLGRQQLFRVGFTAHKWRAGRDFGASREDLRTDPSTGDAGRSVRPRRCTAESPGCSGKRRSYAGCDVRCGATQRRVSRTNSQQPIFSVNSFHHVPTRIPSGSVPRRLPSRASEGRA